MSQAQTAFRHICSSCRSTNTRTIVGPRFSSTLVGFKATCNPELDAIFTHYREQQFIPAALSQYHRRLIYRPSRQDVLVNEPGVTVTLPNDEDYKLQPMKLEDRPPKHKTLTQIKKLLSSTQDHDAWNNIFPFFEGITASRDSVPPWFPAALARKSFELGTHQIIMRCAEQAKITNFRLSSRAITEEMMIGCHRRAADAGFRGDVLLSATRQAEQVAQLFEKKEHCNRELPRGHVDMRQSLMVVGVLLELTAAKSLDLNGGKDDGGQVASYVAKVLAFSGGEVKLPKIEQIKPAQQKYHRAKFLINHIPLWHGMRLAGKVAGAVTAKDKNAFDSCLASLQRQLDLLASELLELEEHRPKRALLLYDQVKSI